MSDLLKNLRNPEWRLANLYKIIDKQAEKKTFRPNRVQEILNKDSSKRRAVLKARQFGITTNEVLRCFDRCIWTPNQTVCIMAHDMKILPKIFKMVKVAHANMPPMLQPRIDRGGGSKYEMHFPDINSTIYTALEVRGGTIHKLHISEAAFIPEDRIRATLQAVPIDCEVTYETTPNGLNHFYDLWNDTDSIINKHFFPWYFHPEYVLATAPITRTPEENRLAASAKKHYGIIITDEQFAFRRFKIKEEFRGKVMEFIAEYPEDDQSCFLSSGSNPFDLRQIKNLIDACPKADSFQVKNRIKWLKPFDKTKTYVIGADPAEGVKRDNSVAVCVCVEDREDVAIFKGQCSPSEFADIITEMGRQYSKAHYYPLAIVERNNHGHAVLLKLNETLHYPNLWLDTDEKIGHRTTSLSRPLLVDNFVEALSSGYFKSNFKEVLSECLTLVDNNGKIEAEDGKHDDAVIAYALAVKASLQAESEASVYNNISDAIRV